MKKITVLQLFIIMILSRLIVTLMYMPSLSDNYNVSDMIAQIPIGTVLMLVTAIPIYLMAKDKSSDGMLVRSSNLSRSYGIVVAIVYLLCFIYGCVRVLLRFEIFATTVIFPESDFRFFLILTLLACLYCVILGLDVLGRTGEIFFAIVMLSVVFVLAATTTKFRLTNFTPFFYDGYYKPFKGGMFTMGSTIELVFPILLKNKIGGKCEKLVYPWLLTSMAITLILIIWQTGALGDYANTQLFPFFSLTSLTTIGFIERLDAILTAVWIICIFVKLSMFIYLGAMCLTTIFKKLKFKTALIVIAVGLCVTSAFLVEGRAVYKLLGNISGMSISYLVAVTLLPAITISGEKIKGRGGNEKQ